MVETISLNLRTPEAVCPQLSSYSTCDLQQVIAHFFNGEAHIKCQPLHFLANAGKLCRIHYNACGQRKEIDYSDIDVYPLTAREVPERHSSGYRRRTFFSSSIVLGQKKQPVSVQLMLQAPLVERLQHIFP